MITMSIIIELLTTPSQVNVELLITILSSITALFVAFMPVLFNRLSRKLKTVDVKVDTISTQVGTITRTVRDNSEENRKEHLKLFKHIREQGKIVEQIVTIKTLNEDIDSIVSKHLEYLHDNKGAMNYMIHKADALKDFSERVLDTKFNITCKEIKAKLDDYCMEVHSRDSLIGEEVLVSLRSSRGKLEKSFANKITQIITDELVNSTEDRFKRAVVYFLDQQSVTLVRTILKNK